MKRSLEDSGESSGGTKRPAYEPVRNIFCMCYCFGSNFNALLVGGW